jgi:hypothetical protein
LAGRSALSAVQASGTAPLHDTPQVMDGVDAVVGALASGNCSLVLRGAEQDLSCTMHCLALLRDGSVRAWGAMPMFGAGLRRAPATGLTLP